MKSTGFHGEIRQISWMWAFAWWSSIGLSIERPIRWYMILTVAKHWYVVRYHTPNSVESAPSPTACIVAHTSSSTHMMPGGCFPSISSHTILLLKYSIGFHLIPSCTYSSCTNEKMHSYMMACVYVISSQGPFTLSQRDFESDVSFSLTFKITSCE